MSDAPAAKLNMPTLYLIAFTGGMTTLAIELSASRLLGNVFGNSNLVWANVIGLMLLYLTVGYFLGGRLADRMPRGEVLLQLILWAAFLAALIPLVARPIISRAAEAVFGAEAALALGSFLVILILFSAPVTLLGMVSPFVIRLAMSDVARSGKVAGQVYAVSTLGSLLGAFLPVLVTIPQIGTTRSFLLFAGLLFLVGVIPLLRQDARRGLRFLALPVIIALLANTALASPLRPPARGAKLLYHGESAYNYIQVQEDAADYRFLYLNEGQGVHSQWHASEVFYGGTWQYFLVPPYFNAPPYRADQVESLLLIGLAAGTTARQYQAIYGNIPMHGIELDPQIIRVGEDYFGMNAAQLPALTVYAGDGRYGLRQLERQFSVIGIDAYRPPYIPWHLTTVEFFAEVKARLTENGAVAINVGRTDTDRRLVDALTATLQQVFPSVHALDVPRSFNTILVATAQPSQPENLRQNIALRAESVDARLYDILTRAADALVPLGESDIVFKDDHAPVERLVDSIVLDFLLAGGAEEFQRHD